MAKPIIFTDNIKVVYNKGKSNEFVALQGETIEIFAHEYIILFGPSGCGKSTLLYSILGVLAPSNGKVFVKGDSIYDYTPERIVDYQRKTIGIMYQQFNLIPSINVIDNVSLPQIFAGVDPNIRTARSTELLKRFGIAEVATKLPGYLSGGQQQRVSVARSLVNNPEILLADEPVGNLDSVSAEQVMNTLEEININDKKTVILVTHDAKYLPYAHRVYYLKDGAVERVVANPEKAQIKKSEPGETIITEIEQLSRIYPYATPEELRVKSVVNYVTQKLSFDQLIRLEDFTEKALEGKISSGSLLRILMEDYSKGGVGIESITAHEMANKMSKVLEQSHEILRYRRIKKNNSLIAHNHDIASKIRRYLLDEQGIGLLPEQQKRLDDAIEQRIAGIMNKERFKIQLEYPLEGGGIGINPMATHELTRYLEKLIAQGVYH